MSSVCLVEAEAYQGAEPCEERPQHVSTSPRVCAAPPVHTEQELVPQVRKLQESNQELPLTMVIPEVNKMMPIQSIA